MEHIPVNDAPHSVCKSLSNDPSKPCKNPGCVLLIKLNACFPQLEHVTFCKSDVSLEVEVVEEEPAMMEVTCETMLLMLNVPTEDWMVFRVSVTQSSPALELRTQKKVCVSPGPLQTAAQPH